MKIDNGTLVLVLDGEKYLLFRNEGDRKYPVLTTLDHKEADNPPTQDQGTDTPGRTHSRVGDGRSAYDETDWHDQAEMRFARRAAEVLEEAAVGEKENGIVVIAAPRTLGELRKHYGRETEDRLLAEIDKDLVGHATEEIAEAILSHTA